VWVHPASVQFAETRWRSGIVVSFERVETATKVFLRDVTEVRIFFFSKVVKTGRKKIKKKKKTSFLFLCARLGPIVRPAFVWRAYRRRSCARRVDRRRTSRRDAAPARLAAHRHPRSTTQVRFLLS